MAALISRILKWAVLLRLRAFPCTQPGLTFPQNSRQVHLPSSGLSCLYKHGFGVDVRFLVPSAVPGAMVSLLQLSDTGTIESDVTGISCWNGFYFDILSTFSTCRWIPHTTFCSAQWWFAGWVPGMHRRRGDNMKPWQKDRMISTS